MRKFVYTICLYLLLGSSARCYDELQENVTQYRVYEGDEGISENSAIQEMKWRDEDLARHIKETPDLKSKITNKYLEGIFRWYSGGPWISNDILGFQTYQVKLINRHPEWVPLIMDGCQRPIFQAFSPPWDTRYDSETSLFQPSYFSSIEILPYHEGCTWEKSREAYRRLFEQYRTVRQYINHSDWGIQRFNAARQTLSETDPVSSRQEHFLVWMMRSIPGVLARFPTREGVEELCQQMEAYPGWNTLAAANALSVCTSEETLPRVKVAFETARRIRSEIGIFDTEDYLMPLEYQRLAARLADVKADLSGMIEGAGFRLIKPDWTAMQDITWNESPPIATSHPAKRTGASVVAAPEIQSPKWYWALLLLVPVTWLARGAWDRRRP